MERKGICKNVGVCSKANKVQIITDDDADFVCPECGEELQPYKEVVAPKKKNSPKLPLIIVGVIGALAIISGCIFAFSGSSNDETQPVATDTIPAIDAAEVVTEVKPDTVVKTDTVVVRDTIVQNNTITTSEKVSTKTVVNTTASKANSGTLHMGYADYSGATKNGKAHGQGRMTFTSSHVIDSRDTKGRVADAGDYVIGEWNEGKLIQGRWYGSDGNVKGSIIIGM